MRQVTLTSSVKLSARNTDPMLLMPTDLVISGCDIWVTCRGSSLVSRYNRHGELQQAISVPTPTGIVVTSTEDRDGCCKKRECRSKCCCQKTIYVASANGNIYTLSSQTTASTVYISPGGTLAGLAWLGGKLYVAEYQNGFVAVYNGTTLELALTDDALTAVGYKPYGIKAIDGKIYITFTNMSSKQGAGYVDVYDPCGCKSLRRIINRENLSIPYGLFSIDDTLVVGNSGSGYISKFRMIHDEKYEYTTNVQNDSGGDIVIDGIMGIAQVDDNKIYYVASADGGTVGSLGVMYVSD